MSSVRFLGRFEDVQADAAMPAGGLVTSFQTQLSSCSAAQGVYDFQVLRPLGGNQYQVLGDTGTQTDPCDSQLHSYPVSISVQAGDVIGVYVVSSWQGVLNFSGSRKPREFRSRRWETPSRWRNRPGRSTSPRRWQARAS